MMTLKHLTADISCEIFGSGETKISGIQYDSRKVKLGDLFFCISGFKTDGHRFAEAAIAGGAAALMVTRKLDYDIPQVLVEDDRLAMAQIACRYYGNPAKKLTMIGVTGTNGKTTITYMLKSALEKAGKKVGLIGTIHNMIGDEIIKTEHTTPEAPDLNALLAHMVEAGCDALVIEVSSHSLALKRVAGIAFDMGIFTNLTQDHLDFHTDFDDYAAAKAKLFEASKKCVLNVDDAAYKTMQAAANGDVKLYGVKNQADYTAVDIEVTPESLSFNYYKNSELVKKLNMHVTGYFNAYNALAVLGALDMLGVDERAGIAALEAMHAVDGRCQVLPTGDKGFSVILDYAHTPDSLESTISSVRRFAKGRIITVFGCGGDRDAKKRPIMGEISGRLSDYSVITSDNPRTEDPFKILDQIEVGMKQTKGDYTVIENRKEAMRYAMQMAKQDDIVILAGKGHETYQEINGVKYDFDEKKVVKDLLDEI